MSNLMTMKFMMELLAVKWQLLTVNSVLAVDSIKLNNCHELWVSDIYHIVIKVTNLLAEDQRAGPFLICGVSCPIIGIQAKV